MSGVEYLVLGLVWGSAGWCWGPAVFLKERKKVAIGDVRQVAWLVNPLSANKPAEFKIK